MSSINKTTQFTAPSTAPCVAAPTLTVTPPEAAADQAHSNAPAPGASNPFASLFLPSPPRPTQARASMPPRADVAPGTNELLKTGNSPQAKVEEVIERASDDPAKVVAELKKQQKSKDANPNASTSSLRTMFEDFSSEAGR